MIRWVIIASLSIYAIVLNFRLDRKEHALQVLLELEDQFTEKACPEPEPEPAPSCEPDPVLVQPECYCPTPEPCPQYEEKDCYAVYDYWDYWGEGGIFYTDPEEPSIE